MRISEKKTLFLQRICLNPVFFLDAVDFFTQRLDENEQKDHIGENVRERNGERSDDGGKIFFGRKTAVQPQNGQDIHEKRIENTGYYAV